MIIIISVALHIFVEIIYLCLILCNFHSSTGVIMRAIYIASLLLYLFFALVEVHSQNAPYLTFMDNNISNHSYVDLNTVGTENTTEVQCHTDLHTCCSGAQGPDRGDWYFPNGNRLPFHNYANMYEGRGDRQVVLQYTGSGGTSGIYCCIIETVAVNDNDGRETVYVGLYTSGGECSLLLLKIEYNKHYYFF